MVAGSPWGRRVRGSGVRSQAWSADEAWLAIDPRRWIRVEKKRRT
jgi:hypothetical protein